MTKFRVFLLAAAIAPFAFAWHALRQSFIPLVEKWQGASSTVIVTNLAARPTRITLSWIGGVPRASQGMVVSEMAIVNAARHSLRGPEVLLYGVSGLALTAGAVYVRKR